MEAVVNEILQEIKIKCNDDIYKHLNNFITVKLNGYKITKEETGLIKYELTESEKWFKMFFITKKLQGLSDRSLKYYRNTLNQAFNRINKPFNLITSDDIKYFLASYQLGGTVNQTSVDNMRRTMNTFFQFLEDEEYILKNPCKKIKKVKQKKVIKKAFNYKEIEELKMACGDKREIAIVTFLLSTGARAEEVSNAKLSDVNFNTGEVKVTGKGNKERITFLNSAALIRLQDYLKNRKGNSEYVFCSVQSPYKQLKVSGLEIIIRNIGKRTEIKDVHPHRFRRTCATIASKRGMKIEEIQRMLGHESLATTQLYIQVDESDVKKSHEKYMN